MDIKTLEDFKLSDAVNFHNQLNPKLFQRDKLRPEVRRHMLLIANDFLSDLGIKDADVTDITLSGSNAAYSYTPHSDVDIHILVNLANLSNDEVYWELFNAKKTLYNDNHKINIYKIPVEVYVQDASEKVISSGEYSILNDKWLHIPVKRKMTLNHKDAKLKYDKLLEFIKLGIASKNITTINRILKKIKQYRQAGLDKGGEFSPENIAYKALRAQDYIDKLYNLRDKLNSERLSIEGMYSQTNDTIQIPLSPRGKATVTVPRILYHSLRGRSLDSHGNISGYPMSRQEKELEQEFDIPSTDGYVWLSPTPYTPAAIKIDASKLDPRNLRLTGQSEGFLIHRGSIPASAIIEKPTTESNSNQVSDPLRFWHNPTKKFNSIKEEIEHVLNLKIHYNQKLNLLEELGKKNRIISEDLDASQIDQIKKLITSFTSHNLVIGHKYIPVPIFIMHDIVMFHDVYNNFPATTPAQFGTLIKINPKDVVLVMDDKLQYTYPFSEYRTIVGATVILLDSIEKYNKLRTYVKLAFEVELPHANNDVTEDASGYIPSEKEKNDPRFKTALTVDIKPNTLQKNAKKLGSKISRAGIPPLLQP